MDGFRARFFWTVHMHGIFEYCANIYMWVMYQLFLSVVLKHLLHRHFVALEIWHLNSDKIVLQTRIEHLDSTLTSRENNIESSNHVMQMDIFIFTSPLCLQEPRWEHATVCWYEGVLWGLWPKNHTHSFLDVFWEWENWSRVTSAQLCWDVRKALWRSGASLSSCCSSRCQLSSHWGQTRQDTSTFLRETVWNGQRL